MREVEVRNSSEIYNRKRRIRQIQQGIWKRAEKLIDLGQEEFIRTLEEERDENIRETLWVSIMERCTVNERDDK